MAWDLHTEIAEIDKQESEQRKQKDHEQAASCDKVWPVVQFLNGRTLLLTPGMRESVPE